MASDEITLSKIEAAMLQVRKFFKATALTRSRELSERFGREVRLKWDSRLRTGSFKERGAISVLSELHARAPDRSKLAVCAASAGNHALALAYYSAQFGIPCHIVMPKGAALVKIEATRRNGAEVQLAGEYFDEAVAFAKELSNKQGYHYVSAFDDTAIIAGQGSCGLEILEQDSSFDSVVVPIGGGGLISGVATAIKAKRPEVKVIGVQSEWALHMRALGATPSKLRPITIADGIGVKGIGELTAPIMKRCVDLTLSVSEDEIATAVVQLLECERSLVEGAGAAAVAALIADKLPADCKRPVFLVCGSNIDLNLLRRLISRELTTRGRIIKVVVSMPDRAGSLSAITALIAGSGANVLEVIHDRSLGKVPGDVSISFVAEVRNRAHAQELLDLLKREGLSPQGG